MKSQGSLVSVGLMALAVAVAGCKKDEPPKPDPAAQAQSVMPPRHPARPPQSRIDPQAMKDYRLDFCYYGTLSLREARDAYLGSLGKDEPSAKKIPSFGVSATPAATPGAATGAGAANGGPAKAPPAPPKPGAAGSAAPGAAPPPRMDFALRLPHERNARACTAAVPLKEPPMGDVDTTLAAFAPFSVELAKDITTAQQYYSRDEATKDNFAKGKDLDKKLREEFAKLDDLSGKFGAALDAWRKEHPIDTSKMEDSEKMSRAMIDDARDVLLLVVNKKADGEAWKAAREKLDKSTGAIKAFAEGHPTDNWSKIMTSASDNFLRTLNGAKVTADKSFDGESLLTLISNFTGLIEARQRAVTRAANPRPMPMAVPNAPSPAPAPAPAPAPH